MQTPEEIIGADALLELNLAGYEVVEKINKGLALVEPDGFEEFYTAYPRKVGKPAALRAYRAALKRKAKHPDIMAGLARYMATRPDPRYIPYPATFLNQSRWEDQSDAVRPAAESNLFFTAARMVGENGQQRTQGSPRDDRHDVVGVGQCAIEYRGGNR